MSEVKTVQGETTDPKTQDERYLIVYKCAGTWFAHSETYASFSIAKEQADLWAASDEEAEHRIVQFTP